MSKLMPLDIPLESFRDTQSQIHPTPNRFLRESGIPAGSRIPLQKFVHPDQADRHPEDYRSSNKKATL